MITLIGLALALAGQDPTPAEAPKPPKPICRRAPSETGSLMPGPRTCHTAAEWRAIDLRERQERGVAVAPPNLAVSAGFGH